MDKILLAVIGLFCLISSSQSCDQARTDECKGDFAAVLGVSVDELDAGIVGNTNRENVTKWCRASETYHSCVQGFKEDCPALTQAKIEGTESVYRYICGEGQEDHLQYSSCLGGREVRVGIVTCNSDFSEKTSGKALTHSQFCQVFSDGLSCVETVTEAACGSDAAAHQSEIETRAWQPLTDQFNCDTESGPSIGVIVGAVVGGVVVISLCICLCYCCLSRQRNNEFDNMSGRAYPYMGNNSAPNTLTRGNFPGLYPGAMNGSINGGPASGDFIGPGAYGNPPGHHGYDEPDYRGKVPVFPQSTASHASYASIPRKA